MPRRTLSVRSAVARLSGTTAAMGFGSSAKIRIVMVKWTPDAISKKERLRPLREARRADGGDLAVETHRLAGPVRSRGAADFSLSAMGVLVVFLVVHATRDAGTLKTLPKGWVPTSSNVAVYRTLEVARK